MYNHLPRPVDEPCELGCSGLSYCSNFNFRPTEMFRRCDAEADTMASKMMQVWGEGTISLPLLLPFEVPVRGKGSKSLQGGTVLRHSADVGLEGTKRL